MTENTPTNWSVNNFSGVGRDINADGGTVSITYISQTSSDAQIRGRELIEASPYIGLEKFEVEDHDKFFGRDNWIRDLTDHLKQKKVLLLLGASGSGKSSLIQAGLIPALKKQQDFSGFKLFSFVPDVNPFESFYGCLLTKYKQSEAKLAQTVKEDTLIKVVQSLKHDSQWLIFIDQFEEVFTRTPKRERDIFIKSLIQLIESPDNSVRVVMTMRADFLDKLSPYPDLGKVHDFSSRMLTDMDDSELRLAIAEPAARNGVIFEKRLIDTIIADFKQQAGSLPLLQYTLNLLWSKDDIQDRVLNIKTYQELGGVTGALQQQANKIYDKFDETQQKLAKEIFLKLISLEGKEAVSRRADKAIFEQDETQKDVLYQLIDNRLLVSKGEDGKATVEVAHEALICSWKVLQELIREKEEIIVIRNRLYADAKQWDEIRRQDAGKANSELWSGSKLARIVEYKKEQALPNLNRVANEFIEASLAETERIEKEREKEQRKVKAYQLAYQSELLRNQQPKLLQRSLLLAVESIKRHHSVEIELPLKQSLSLLPRPLATLSNENNSNFKTVNFSPDGLYLGAGDWAGNAQIWRWEENQYVPFNTIVHQAKFSKQDKDQFYISSIFFNKDYLITVCDEKWYNKDWNYCKASTIWTRNIVDNNLISYQTLPMVLSVAFCSSNESLMSLQCFGNARIPSEILIKQLRNGKLDLLPKEGYRELEIFHIDYSFNGKYLAFANQDSIFIIHKEKNEIIQNIECKNEVICDIKFSPDEYNIAVVTRKNNNESSQYLVTIFHIETKKEVIRIPQSDFLSAISFSPDGKYLATAIPRASIVYVWDSFSGQEVYRIPHINLINEDFISVHNVVFSPLYDGGYTLATASDKVRVWRLYSALKTASIIHANNNSVIIRGVNFTPDGKYLVTAGDDCFAKIWETKTGKQILCLLHDHVVRKAIFSPDSKYLATVSGSQAIIWKWKENSQSPYRLIDRVSSVAFSPNSQYLATTAVSHVKLWELSTGNIIKEYTHADNVASVAFSPDGKMITAGSMKGITRIWRVSSGEIIRDLMPRGSVNRD